jgi:hypothetical protein
VPNCIAHTLLSLLLLYCGPGCCALPPHISAERLARWRLHSTLRSGVGACARCRPEGRGWRTELGRIRDVLPTMVGILDGTGLPYGTGCPGCPASGSRSSRGPVQVLWAGTSDSPEAKLMSAFRGWVEKRMCPPGWASCEFAKLCAPLRWSGRLCCTPVSRCCWPLARGVWDRAVRLHSLHWQCVPRQVQVPAVPSTPPPPLSPPHTP